MAKYAVTVYYTCVELTGPHQEVKNNDGRVRASYRVAGDTYHIVRAHDRNVNDDVLANLVINHAQSLGFRGSDVVRLKPARQRSKTVSERQLGLFDLGDDNA